MLRGVAILGILPVNAAFFAYAAAIADDPRYPEESGLVAAALVRTICEYKFITLFSLLFGVGVAIQRQRLDARGEAFAPLIVRRLLALGLFGFLLLLFLRFLPMISIFEMRTLVPDSEKPGSGSIGSGSIESGSIGSGSIGSGPTGPGATAPQKEEA